MDGTRFACEYQKLDAFRRFKASVVDYFYRFIEERIRIHNVKSRKAPDTRTTAKFVDGIFIKWWFSTSLHEGIEAFMPKESLHVQVGDIAYCLRSYGIQPNEADLDYDRDYIRSLCDRYRSEALACDRRAMSASLSYGKILVRSDAGRIIETLNISPAQEAGLRRRFRTSDQAKSEKDSEELANAAAVLVMRLLALGSMSEHLSIPPKLLYMLGIDLECFGTPLNTTLPNFCSPFPDVDRMFGSHGNVMNLAMESGKRYTFNPPYDLDLMTAATQHLLRQLRTVPNISVVVVFPVWDSASQRSLGGKDYGEPFPAFELLQESGYVRDRKIFRKEEHYFYDYFSDTFVPVANTHLLLVSNEEKLPEGWDINALTKEWASVSPQRKPNRNRR